MEWFLKHKERLSIVSQSILILLGGILVGLFASTLISTTQVLAADASWDDHEIVYKEENYQKVTDPKLYKKLGIDEGKLLYTKESSGSKEIKAIYFDQGSDFSSELSANYKTYTRGSQDSYQQKEASIISISPPSENNASTSCRISGFGWLLCPLSGGIAWTIDKVYSQLENFLKVKPLETTNQKSSLYVAWNIMRNISNVAFVIAFLVIIYSQTSSIGIGSYGIKKMLPRLIIAAIVVNLSFLICAVALDISNVLGYAVQDMFMGIKNSIDTIGEGVKDPLTWQEITLNVLGGGAAAGAAIIYGAELLPYLLPILVLVGLTILIVLLIMAARQALIVILIVISPIAFVCYILPGTEKWFEKWRSTFLTMLLFFPAFSLIFGGAQVAGGIIIQSASGPNGSIMMILGMAVQIIPLALTPLILKLGGGVLSKFTGMVNDKKRGIFDKSINTAKDRSEIKKHQKLNSNNPRRIFSRTRRHFRNAEMSRKERLATGQKQSENLYSGTRAHKLNSMYSKQAEKLASALAEEDTIRFESMEAGHPVDDVFSKHSFADHQMRRLSSRYLARSDMRAENAKKQLVNEAQEASRRLALAGLSKSSIQRVQNDQLAKYLEDNKDVRELAGQVEDLYFKNNNGSQRILASAVQTRSSAYEESIKNAQAILSGSNVSNEDMVKLIKGHSVGNIMATDDIRAAAMRNIVGGKDAYQLNELLKTIDFSSLSDGLAQEMGEALLANTAKPAWVGGVLASQIKANAVKDTGENVMRNWLKTAIETDAFSAETLVTQDAIYLKDLEAALKDSTFKSSVKADKLTSLKESIETVKTDALYSGRIGKRKDVIDSIESML